ncbi:MAG: four helix bundle protein [Ignavibacteriaceae bacterium]
MANRQNIIQDKSFTFALNTIALYKKLVGQKEYIISKQLLKCGTSIGANVNESIAAQSKKDFISKMSIAAKEARETKYWLQLLQESQLVSTDYNNYLLKIEEIIKILTSIIKTAQLRK